MHTLMGTINLIYTHKGHILKLYYKQSGVTLFVLKHEDHSVILDLVSYFH